MSRDVPPIRLRALTKRFGTTTAVDNVTLTVDSGEIVGLLGANGAGKTTVMRMLMGLLSPTAGEVSLFGAVPSRKSRLRVGYLPQGLGLYPDLTVRENLKFTQHAFGGVANVAASTMDSDVAAEANTIVRSLPLGLRRRVAFTMTVQHHPELLVLDEPTSGVDPLNRARLWQTIRDIADSGVAVLVSTHFTEETQNCDRLIMLHEGQVRASGTQQEIIGARTAIRVVTDAWERVFTALDEHNIAVSLHGKDLRVIGVSSAEVAEIIEKTNISVTLSEVPASFDEVFVELVTERSVIE